MTRIRDPAVAGMFYPKNKIELMRLLDELNLKSKTPLIESNVRAIIVPHAGYIYSGYVASSAYKLLSKQNKSKNHYTIIGPSHYFGFYNIATSTYEEWRTPLGTVKVRKLIERLQYFDIAMAHEHSIEVQIPFLQYYINSFEIFPIITGKIENLEKVVKELDKIKSDTTYIISSDLSHYYSYDIAVKKDKETIQSILNLDLERFLSVGEACGKEGIKIIIEMAKNNNWKTKFIDYMNSGDISKNKDSVVGYAAIAFIED